MKKVNIAINTRNTFLRESLVSVVNELISRSGNLKVAFSYKHNDFLDKDIIIAEVLPGEIYLCNTSIKNRKKNSSVIILHSYDKLPEKELIVNCLKGVIFVSIKSVNIDEMFEIIAQELKRSEILPDAQSSNSTLVCTHCPHKMLSKSQAAVATGIIDGFDIIKISALNKVTPKPSPGTKAKSWKNTVLITIMTFFSSLTC